MIWQRARAVRPSPVDELSALALARLLELSLLLRPDVRSQATEEDRVFFGVEGPIERRSHRPSSLRLLALKAEIPG
jgi:hypothetical protein